MKIIVELNSEEIKTYNVEILRELAETTIDLANVVNTDGIVTISVAIVTTDEMKRINGKLRNKNTSTDVISIGDFSDDNNVSEVRNEDIFLGEIILCYNYIEISAQQNGISVDREFFTVYAHGILHLLGFKHGEEMFQLQNDVAEKFCNL